MIAPSTVGFSSRQLAPLLVTEMKSEPKKTPETPSSANSAFGERRLPRPLDTANIERAGGHDGSAGQKLQGRRIWGDFGLDEHGFLPNVRFKAGAGQDEGDAAEIAHRQTER